MLSLRILRQQHGVSDMNTASSPTRLLQARMQLPRRKTGQPALLRHMLPNSLQHRGVEKAWFKWRGPLPMTMNFGHRSVRGNTVFVHRYRYGTRLVAHFWLRQGVEPHVVRWSKLGSITPPRRMVSERAGKRGGAGFGHTS